MAGPTPLLYGSILFLVIVVGFIVAGNATVLLQHGFGVSTTRIGVWRTCEAQPTGDDKCYSVTSNSQCSELSSRMKAIGAFGVIGVVSTLLTIAAFFFEGRGMDFPVTHLTKIIFSWSLLMMVICVSISIGTLVAKLCSDPVPMTDRNGSFGPAFYFFFSAAVLQIIAGAVYALFKVKRDAAPAEADSDDDDDKKAAFNDL